MDVSLFRKLSDKGKEFVTLAYQLPPEDLRDLICYLKTRLAIRKACGDECKPLSLEQWYGLSHADRYMLFWTATQADNTYLVRFVKSWFFLKPWQKAYLYVLAVWYYYTEMVHNWCQRFSNNAIGK
jgi:hypothetical protein